MKKIFAFLLVLAVASCFAFAGDYNTGDLRGSSTNPEEGQVNATGNVVANPIVLYPEVNGITLPDIHAGQTMHWDPANIVYKCGFSLSAQATYTIEVNCTDVKLEDNGTDVLWAWRFGQSATEWFPSGGTLGDPVIGGADGWWRVRKFDVNYIPGTYNDGTLVGQAAIYEWSADAGAPVGPRSFYVKFTLEYFDGL